MSFSEKWFLHSGLCSDWLRVKPRVLCGGKLHPIRGPFGGSTAGHHLHHCAHDSVHNSTRPTYIDMQGLLWWRTVRPVPKTSPPYSQNDLSDSRTHNGTHETMSIGKLSDFSLATCLAKNPADKITITITEVKPALRSSMGAADRTTEIEM